MDIHDYVELITLVLWLISIIGISILSHIHFKIKRLEQFRITADNLMKSYIGLYNKESLANDQKIDRVVSAVVDELKAKGFKVEDQDVKDIFAKVAKIVNENSSK